MYHLGMRKTYPFQTHIRWADKEEKQKAKEFAEKNNISESNAARLVYLRAIREGWEFDLKPKGKK